jgi:Berberine and berberine like
VPNVLVEHAEYTAAQRDNETCEPVTSRVREAYGDHIYRRLAEVKAKYDPDNAFHHNKNIGPVERAGDDRRGGSWIRVCK